MDDHLIALDARVAPLAADFQSLMAAGLKACGPLYPDGPDVSSQEELEKMLKGTKERLQVWRSDRKSTRLNSSHSGESRMPSSA